MVPNSLRNHGIEGKPADQDLTEKYHEFSLERAGRRVRSTERRMKDPSCLGRPPATADWITVASARSTPRRQLSSRPLPPPVLRAEKDCAGGRNSNPLTERGHVDSARCPCQPIPDSARTHPRICCHSGGARSRTKLSSDLSGWQRPGLNRSERPRMLASPEVAV